MRRPLSSFSLARSRTPQNELNQEHKITQKLGDGLKTGVAAAQDFDAKHDVSGNIGRGLTGFMNSITSALNKDGSKPPPPPPGAHGR